jgi:hypothetical protein
LAIDDLLAVVPVGDAGSPVAVDWVQVEENLGYRLPNDYKDLVARYGEGCFSQFIHIYQPVSSLDAIDLGVQQGKSLWALRYLRDEGEDIPYRLDEPAELLTFGRTDNGDIFFWHCDPLGSPEDWTVLVKEPRGDDWFGYRGGVTKFLADVVSGEIEVPFFPRGFPTLIPGFQSY